MKPRSLALIGCFLATLQLPCIAAEEDSVVDKIVRRDIETGPHSISFCSRGDGSLGHAFILLASQNDTTQACTIDAAVGFWPDTNKSKERLLALFRPLPGKLVDELKASGTIANAECRLTIPLTKSEFEILKIKLGKYDGQNYVLLGNDCVTFCEEVARDVFQLKVPDREQLFKEFKSDVRASIVKGTRSDASEETVIERFPVRYIRKLGDLNGTAR